RPVVFRSTSVILSGMRWLPVLGLVVVAGCAAPLAVHRQDAVLAEVDAHYRAFYPADGDPDPKHDAGLLRPRFGLPAIAQAGQPFAVEWLERGGPATVRAALIAPTVTDAQAERCLAGEAVAGCHPLTLAAAARTPNAVWLRADDPATLGQVRVVHLSDIHIGKHVDDVEAHLEQVIAETNALQPDLVVVTGDVVNQGTDASLHPKARALLETIHAPVAIVLGNHDIGFRSFVGAKYGSGWENFGRTFHAFLEFEI